MFSVVELPTSECCFLASVSFYLDVIKVICSLIHYNQPCGIWFCWDILRKLFIYKNFESLLGASMFVSYAIMKELLFMLLPFINFLYYSLYNNIHHPSKLAVGADFHCFKYKIEPKWEDPVCANGGKWSVTFHRGKSDRCWLYTVSFRALVYT